MWAFAPGKQELPEVQRSDAPACERLLLSAAEFQAISQRARPVVQSFRSRYPARVTHHASAYSLVEAEWGLVIMLVLVACTPPLLVACVFLVFTLTSALRDTAVLVDSAAKEECLHVAVPMLGGSRGS